MENSENFVLNNQPVKEEQSTNFGTVIGSALAYFFSMLAFILFVCPFSFWKAAALRLHSECKKKTLFKFVETSRWPFLSFMKKVFFEFFIDGTIFISYFIGAIAAFYVFFESKEFLGFLMVLIATYYSPLGLSIVRDLCTLMLLPFQKFLSWVSKPAQQLDVDFHNR